ncbi:flagellar protein FliO/FliZ [Oikeobacillus pervagus]|uniref:Flagellar protein FliO/FliZ n=1 Tax=Oikeobacillus pervagus TaxID=1325931 RepID=A0AAJ1WI50_9BACI|nr:flagellar biosynthetic protein FliO [Oikeobacillus pervagus]MDQ0214290.1 flagellar protein FliO/FliZ [Oikeobacillus pervagus]
MKNRLITSLFAFTLSFCLALFWGNGIQTFAESFDQQNVKDCYEHPDKCKKNIDNTKANPIDSTETSNGVNAWNFMKMIGALLFVIALIYFLLKFINQRSRTYQQTKMIQHLGGSPLGGNRSVQIVKVGNRIFVLGIGENVELLKEIDEPNEYNQLIHMYNDNMDQMLQTKDLFTTLVQKVKGHQKDQKRSGHQSKPFRAIFTNQLEDLKKERRNTLEKFEDKGKKLDE